MPKYTETVRQLCNSKLGRLTTEKEPEVVTGTVTPRIESLRRRLVKARREQEHCSAQLKRHGLEVGSHGGLSVTYERSRKIKGAWKTKHAARVQAVHDLRLRAAIDLIDLPAVEAKAYLKRLDAELRKI